MSNTSLIRSLKREYDKTMKEGAKNHRKGFPAEGDALFEAAAKIQEQIDMLSAEQIHTKPYIKDKK